MKNDKRKISRESIAEFSADSAFFFPAVVGLAVGHGAGRGIDPVPGPTETGVVFFLSLLALLIQRDVSVHRHHLRLYLRLFYHRSEENGAGSQKVHKNGRLR